MVFLTSSIGFVWTGFGIGGATGMAFLRSCQKLPPYPREPMPASSRMNPPLSKAEPIRAGGSASGTTDFKERQKNPGNFSQ